MKKILAVIIVLSMLFLVACSSHKDIPISNSLEIVSYEHEIEKIGKYNSPYTAGFKDKNGNIILYIFSSPVQFVDDKGNYTAIDNRLTKSEKENYAYENNTNVIKMFFPNSLNDAFIMEKSEQTMQFKLKDVDGFGNAQKCSFINMYGDNVEAVSYDSKEVKAYFYPTNLGIRMELEIISIKGNYSNDILVDLNGKDMLVSEGKEYISLYNENKHIGIVYSSLSKKNTENSMRENELTLKDETSSVSATLSYEVGTQSDKTAVKSDMSFEFYDNKMPDSTACEKLDYYPYLSNYYELGNEIKGETNHFLRMRLNYFMTTQSKNILSADYYVKVLNKIGGDESNKIKMNEVNSQWSSKNLSWETKGKVGDEISKLEKDKNRNTHFDVTKFVKECVDDLRWGKESTGAMISSNHSLRGNYCLATSDNSLYPPYIRITMKDEPIYFQGRDSINYNVL